MEHIAKQPWVATSTDGGIALPEDGPSTHARFYGSFTRKISHYAIERGAITLEHRRFARRPRCRRRSCG